MHFFGRLGDVMQLLEFLLMSLFGRLLQEICWERDIQTSGINLLENSFQLCNRLSSQSNQHMSFTKMTELLLVCDISFIFQITSASMMETTSGYELQSGMSSR